MSNDASPHNLSRFGGPLPDAGQWCTLSMSPETPATLIAILECAGHSIPSVPPEDIAAVLQLAKTCRSTTMDAAVRRIQELETELAELRVENGNLEDDLQDARDVDAENAGRAAAEGMAMYARQVTELLDALAEVSDIITRTLDRTRR